MKEACLAKERVNSDSEVGETWRYVKQLQGEKPKVWDWKAEPKEIQLVEQKTEKLRVVHGRQERSLGRASRRSPLQLQGSWNPLESIRMIQDPRQQDGEGL